MSPTGGSPWREAAIAHVHQWAPGLRTLRLAAALPPFRAGQFVRLGLEEGRLGRSYSMASAPGEPPEFLVVDVEGGALSPRLLALGVGDPVWVDPRPAGRFALERVPDAATLFLIASGTGLGPYVSMLRTPEPWERFDRLVVVHGVRVAAHFAYREELERRSQEHGGQLVWVGAVTREPAPEGALQGRVTDLLRSGALEAAAGERLDPARSQVMLCGNPAMVDEVQALLATRGLRRNRPRAPGHVTFEKYW